MMKASYWVVQHIHNVVRQEHHNVGIILQVGEQFFGRFKGEDAKNQIDGRRLKGVASPLAYKQWVAHWRTHMSDIEYLRRTMDANYRIRDGGPVNVEHVREAQATIDHLYSLLVA